MEHSETSTCSDDQGSWPTEIYNEFNANFKTSLCKKYVRDGYCPYEFKCQFAHGYEELVNCKGSVMNYKTRVCVNFAKKGCCPYGFKCNFLHPQEFGKKGNSKKIEKNFGGLIREEVRERKAFSRRSSRLLELVEAKEGDFSGQEGKERQK